MIRHFCIFCHNCFVRIKISQRAVRFWCSGKIKRRLCKHVLTFRQTDAVKSRGTRLNHADGIRVGKPSVFTCGNEHTPKNKVRIFAGAHHARHPVKRGIGVASAKALYECTDYVVMIVAVTVVKHNLALNALFGSFFAYVNRRIFGRNTRHSFRLPFVRCSFNCKLKRIKQTSRIAVCSFYQMLQCAFFKLNVPSAVASFLVFKCGISCFKKVFICKRLELKDTASADERLIHFKKRIFCCSPNKNYRAVLNPRQKRVLLALVPAVHFVNKKNCAPAVKPVLLVGGFN